jgi:hypothetical protein
MIVHDLDVFCTRRCPSKTDSPLVVDANAVLALSVGLQRFEVIAWRYPQVVQSACDLQLPEFAPGHDRYVGEPPAPLAGCQGFGITAAKRPDHVLDNNA